MAVAQALEEQGATFYGAYWCGFCNQERQALGKEALARVRYVECDPRGAGGAPTQCTEAGVDAFPTWVLRDGRRQSGAAGLEGLEAFLGIKAPNGAATAVLPSQTAP
mmetsp:Transcript_32548/g.73520  ORF Transcript_32548/g.73520 Transcript_32548/m.73520 type:complete len:107 (-) Transcript_32548:26-346(-)